MTNGYIVLTKGEPNLYKHAIEAITLGKPIYYADGNKVAFVNSIELVSTNVVIKTSDKQITVASDGTTIDVSLKEYTHHVVLQITVTDDNVSDMYALITIKSTKSTSLTLNEVKDELTKFDYGGDYILSMNASGENIYSGITYNSSENKYLAVFGNSELEITNMDLYSDLVD